MDTEGVSSAASEEARRRELEQVFTVDGCERLMQSNHDYQRTHGHYVPALAELVNLLRKERDEAALRLRDASLGGNGSHWDGCWRSHIDCAVARLAAVEAERDRAWNTCSTCREMSGGSGGCEECSEFLSEAELAHRSDLHAAEAESARYREALEQIVQHNGFSRTGGVREIARSALAGVGGVPGDTQPEELGGTAVAVPSGSEATRRAET